MFKDEPVDLSKYRYPGEKRVHARTPLWIDLTKTAHIIYPDQSKIEVRVRNISYAGMYAIPIRDIDAPDVKPGPVNIFVETRDVQVEQFVGTIIRIDKAGGVGIALDAVRIIPIDTNRSMAQAWKVKR